MASLRKRPDALTEESVTHVTHLESADGADGAARFPLTASSHPHRGCCRGHESRLLDALIWEILCDVRGSVHHQRFRVLGFGDVPKKKAHDRRDGNGLLTH